MAKSEAYQDSIYPVGGMDQDSDQRYIGKGDYRMMVNGVRFGDDNYGVIKNIKGTGEIDLSSITGIAAYTQVKLAGSVYDYANNGTILLISTYDGSWHKHIIRYKGDGTLEPIQTDNSYLNFDESASV